MRLKGKTIVHFFDWEQRNRIDRALAEECELSQFYSLWLPLMATLTGHFKEFAELPTEHKEQWIEDVERACEPYAPLRAIHEMLERTKTGLVFCYSPSLTNAQLAWFDRHGIVIRPQEDDLHAIERIQRARAAELGGS